MMLPFAIEIRVLYCLIVNLSLRTPLCSFLFIKILTTHSYTRPLKYAFLAVVYLCIYLERKRVANETHTHTHTHINPLPCTLRVIT